MSVPAPVSRGPFTSGGSAPEKSPVGTRRQCENSASLVPPKLSCQVRHTHVFPVDWIEESVYLHEQERMEEIRWVTNSWS